MVLASGAVLALGVYGEVLVPSVVLDLVSFWPGLVLAVLLALALWPLRRRGPARLAAVLPLLLLTWMWVVVALHLAEWELLPSAAADLVGPTEVGLEEADLSVTLEEALMVSAEEGSLYEVRPLREAGGAGVPEALERLEDEAATVVLVERDPGRWFRNAGWRVGLSPIPAWHLEVRAAQLDLELQSLHIRELVVAGEGVLQLPPPLDEVPVSLEGRMAVTVPSGVGVVVLGSAEVPGDWVVTDEGWRSPSREPGYVLTIAEGSRVRITESG